MVFQQSFFYGSWLTILISFSGAIGSPEVRTARCDRRTRHKLQQGDNDRGDGPGHSILAVVATGIRRRTVFLLADQGLIFYISLPKKPETPGFICNTIH